MIQATQHELIEKLAELQQLSPDVRFGQLMANVGFLVKDQTDQSLWDVEDATASSKSSRSTVPTCSGASRPEPNIDEPADPPAGGPRIGFAMTTSPDRAGGRTEVTSPRRGRSGIAGALHPVTDASGPSRGRLHVALELVVDVDRPGRDDGVGREGRVEQVGVGADGRARAERGRGRRPRRRRSRRRRRSWP